MFRAAILLSLILFCSAAHGAKEWHERADLTLHYSLSLGGFAVSTYLLERNGLKKNDAMAYSAALVLVAGLSKELFLDKELDKMDLFADAAGVATGLLLVQPIRWEF